jgi:hypothetical protein
MADIFFSVELGQNWIGWFVWSQPDTGMQQSSSFLNHPFNGFYANTHRRRLVRLDFSRADLSDTQQK